MSAAGVPAAAERLSMARLSCIASASAILRRLLAIPSSFFLLAATSTSQSSAERRARVRQEPDHVNQRWKIRRDHAG